MNYKKKRIHLSFAAQVFSFPYICMMTKDELDFKINLAYAKGRNIYYYRCIDRRERATYIHVVRDYRKTLVSLLHEMPQGNPWYSVHRKTILSLIRCIDPKVTTEECTGTILEIGKLLGANE